MWSSDGFRNICGMQDGEQAIPLSGGRVTRGVVRIGNTVRRPSSPNSEFVSRLLLHLARHGFDAVPVPLGMDTHGRDVLTFLEGDVPAELGYHEDATLQGAAMLIRRFHDASARLAAMDWAGIEIICHNDLSPCNFVFREGTPNAIIDFDAAAPGTRAHDLGYAAWLWLDIGSPDFAPNEQGRRLSVFLAAYGDISRQGVMTAMLARQADLAEQGHQMNNTAMAEWAAGCLEWTRCNAAALGQS